MSKERMEVTWTEVHGDLGLKTLLHSYYLFFFGYYYFNSEKTISISDETCYAFLRERENNVL